MAPRRTSRRLATAVAIGLLGTGCHERPRTSGTLAFVAQPALDASTADANTTMPSAVPSRTQALWEAPTAPVETDPAALQLLGAVVDALARSADRELETLLGSPGHADATGATPFQISTPVLASAVGFDRPARMIRLELRGAIRGAELDAAFGAFEPAPDAHRADAYARYERTLAGGRVEVTCYVPVEASFAEAAVRQFDLRVTSSP